MIGIDTANNCPNCGAPIVAPVCDYCGTRHWGFEQASDYPASKVTQMLSQGLVTANEAREMLGFRRLSEQQTELEYELIKAKTKYLQDSYEIKRLYNEAIDAMRSYRN